MNKNILLLFLCVLFLNKSIIVAQDLTSGAEEAITNPELNEVFGLEGVEWVTSEDFPWEPSPIFSGPNDEPVAQTPVVFVDPGSSSWVEAELSGPAFLRFDCRLGLPFLDYSQHEFLMLLDEDFVPLPLWQLEYYWQELTVFIPPGAHNFRIQFSTPKTFEVQTNILLVGNMSIERLDFPEPVEGMTLAQSLDSSDIVWDTYSLTWDDFGTGDWYPQSNITFDGEDAAISGIAGQTALASSSVLTTSLQGPGVLEYQWYYETNSGGDYSMEIDGFQAGFQRLDETWTHRTYIIPEGEYIIHFTHSYPDFSFDSIIESYGILDQVKFRPGEQISIPEGTLPVGESIDSDHLKWKSGGDNLWYSDSSDISNGLIAHSEATEHPGDSWIETTINGSGMFDIEWIFHPREESEDKLVLTLNGEIHSELTASSDWEKLSFYVEEGIHNITIRHYYENRSDTPDSNGAAWLRNIAFREGETPSPPSGSLPLSESLDNDKLEWLTAGDAAWFGQTSTSFDNVDAAASGEVQPDESTWMETNVEGPGKLSFVWGVSSQPESDYLLLDINGSSMIRISGSQNWKSEELFLPGGSHKIRFTFYKNSFENAGAGRGWVDEFDFIQGAEPEQNPDGITFSEALDVDGLLWNTGGDGNWTPSNNLSESFDGVDVAASGPVDSVTKLRWMATFIEGPATISFFWKYDFISEFDFDYDFDNYLVAYLGDEEIAYCQSRSWTRVEAFIPPGKHVLKFEYGQDYFALYPGLGAWVDQFEINNLQYETPELWVTRTDAGLAVHVNGTAELDYDLWGAESIHGPYELIQSNIASEVLSEGYDIDFVEEMMFFKVSIRE